LLSFYDGVDFAVTGAEGFKHSDLLKIEGLAGLVRQNRHCLDVM
jgi:hypothetical protein